MEPSRFHNASSEWSVSSDLLLAFSGRVFRRLIDTLEMGLPQTPGSGPSQGSDYYVLSVGPIWFVLGGLAQFHVRYSPLKRPPTDKRGLLGRFRFNRRVCSDVETRSRGT